MKAYDAEKAALIESAIAKNEVLRYVGVVDTEAKSAKVTLARSRPSLPPPLQTLNPKP